MLPLWYGIQQHGVSTIIYRFECCSIEVSGRVLQTRNIRNYYVKTTFWHNNCVLITFCVCWGKLSSLPTLLDDQWFNDDVIKLKHFRVTDLCGEFTGNRWFPFTKAGGAELRCFLWSVPEKRLSKQSKLRWFETQSRSLWRHSNDKFECCSMVASGRGNSRRPVISHHTVIWDLSARTRRHFNHDDVIKWKHFPRNWPFVRGIHRSPVNSPHKGQWHGALIFSLISTRINGWVNNGEAGDLRRHRAHYEVIVMTMMTNQNDGSISNLQTAFLFSTIKRAVGHTLGFRI